MTSTPILILNIVLDVGILALLAFVMTRAAKLTPHVPRVPARRTVERRATREPVRAGRRRVASAARA
jgi:hypothetical protein